MDMSPSADARKVFVGGLAPSVDDDAMRTYFAKFGPVAESMVMYDQDTTRSRGFGFVTFGEDVRSKCKKKKECGVAKGSEFL